MNGSRRDPACIALIDIGNTRMKVGWVNARTGQRESQSLAVEHQHLERVAAWFAEQRITPKAALGVNVAGQLKAQAMNQLFLDRFNLGVQWLSSQRQAARVLNRYTTPQQLGADRWLSMIGLSQVPSDGDTPLLLASFGTATTLDTLCPIGLARGRDQEPYSPDPGTEWVYDGGLIFPGPALMRSSLAKNTAQLPEADGQTTAFPLDTHQAITSGIAAAQAGAVVRQWQAVYARYGVAPAVYCTGGGWPVVATEAQALLAQTQALNGVPLRAIQPLASPILDGLACLSRTL